MDAKQERTERICDSHNSFGLTILVAERKKDCKIAHGVQSFGLTIHVAEHGKVILKT